MVDVVSGIDNELPLLKSAFSEYFRRCCYVSDFGFQNPGPFENVIYSAGRAVFDDYMLRIDEYQKSHNLIEHIEKISSLAYEKDEVQGKIMILSKSGIAEYVPDTFYTLKFDSDYTFNQHKIFRKLLQMVAGSSLIILASKTKAYGLIDRITYNILKKQQHLLINMKKGRVWEFDFKPKNKKCLNLFISEYGQFKFPDEKIDYDILKMRKVKSSATEKRKKLQKGKANVNICVDED